VRRAIAILDSEVNTFGRHEGHSALTCAAETAARLLSRHPDVTPHIGLIAVGAARMARAEGLGNGLPQHIAKLLGLPRVAGVEVHAFCASANAAVHQAALVLEAGQADAALVVGLEHILAVQPQGPLQPEAAGPEGRRGYSPPVFYALCADRYLHDTGASPQALAEVSVNNRKHGAKNIHARFQTPVTIEEVLASRMIAAPLTLLQCCPQADGAGSLLLVARDAVPVHNDASAVDLLGLGSASADPEAPLLTSFVEDVESGLQAYASASVAPEDVDVAEIHDAFTISQVIHLEDLGLAPRGQGWRHALEVDPRLVVNPSGGLLSRGHPLGATGIAQFDGVRRYLLDERIDPLRRRIGLVQEAGGLTANGQLLSECAIVARPGAAR
jgi:acetyl-CoA acyltransferase